MVGDPRELFFDARLGGYCVYCGGAAESRDHVPSKVLLDDPLPNDLPVVSCCTSCNAGFSTHEAYVACLLDVVRSGSVDAVDSMRPKVRAILERSPALRESLKQERVETPIGITWAPNPQRVESVLYKLAQGHAAFELAAPLLGPPTDVRFQPIVTMSAEEVAAFETLSRSELWSEIGSRRFLAEVKVAPQPVRPWTIVQFGRYRYGISESEGINVRFVIGDYLACDVRW